VVAEHGENLFDALMLCRTAAGRSTGYRFSCWQVGAVLGLEAAVGVICRYWLPTRLAICGCHGACDHRTGSTLCLLLRMEKGERQEKITGYFVEKKVSVFRKVDKKNIDRKL
jgi:hypothetical protein